MGRVAGPDNRVGWWQGVPATPQSTPGPVPTRTYDLVVVGGGLTGLWTAYYAKQRDPDRSVLLVEAETVGFGASGRNGGWLSSLLPGNRAVWRRTSGLAAVRALQRAVVETVGEVLTVCEHEGIAAGQHRGGDLCVARTPAGLERLRARHAGDLEHGHVPSGSVLLDAAGVHDRVRVAGALGGLHHPDTAVLDPGRLVRGLAAVVRELGVDVLEHTRVTALGSGRVETERGPLRAALVACCTEGYSGPLVGARGVVPVNSSMILTAPVPREQWRAIGWQGREALSDAAHTFVYAQHTADGRIAIGGRGSPYRYGSGTGDGSVDRRTVEALQTRLQDLLPALDVEVEHAWSGVLGVTRDWCARIAVADGTGVALGYAGHGVTATNLAARTLLDRLEGRTTPLTTLPWNDHDPGRWEPEPLRWVGIHAMYRLFRVADAWEEARRARRTSVLARVGARLAGLAD